MLVSEKWKQIVVANDDTHHLLDGRPLYQKRFDHVLKYHDCGLAPVEKDGEAWHIDMQGVDAYPHRFLRVFGFYEGRAAVVSPSGWHHILTDGKDAYDQRHAWCGNFQEMRCTVRERDGLYVHILPDGRKAYQKRWRYAGDYRDGTAVVQSDDGRSTHIDSKGNQVHGKWFYDLDVFHKGFARARDDRGWMHLGLDGRIRYGRRFAMVEPFYNGQARVERFDGGVEVIDEQGQTIVELRPAVRNDFQLLSGDLVGFWRTQTIGASAKLGVFDALPATANKIAACCGLEVRKAYRLLRALGELELVDVKKDIWQPSRRGAYLQSDHPMTLADAAIEYAGHFTKIWDGLPDSLRSGSRWQAPDIFKEVEADQERVLPHHRMLRSYARHDYEAVVGLLDLSGKECVIDAGGGLGVFADLLLNRHPQLRVILLDRPEVIALVDSMQPMDCRMRACAADIFQPWGIKGDVIILSRVLHDWNDERALEILNHARDSLNPGGRIFIVEMLLSADSHSGGLCDLHLLLVNGGQERTLIEYETLLQKSGFTLNRVYRSQALTAVIEGKVK